MHIAIVVPSYLPHYGGAEVGVHQVMRYLAESTSHRFSVIAATNDSSLPRHENMDGVEVYRYVQPKQWLRWYAPTLASFLHVPRLVNQLKPDLIYITYTLPTGLSAWLSAKILDIPIVMMLGGVDLYDPFSRPDRFLRGLSGMIMRRANKLIAWSSWMRDYISKHYGIAKERIEVIPFGIDNEVFKPNLEAHHIRERHGIADDTILLFALQRLEIRKGVDVLLRAVKHVTDTCPEMNWKLIIAGKGRDKEALEQLRKELGLEERVIFAGFVADEEKPLYYNAADIFSFHSYHEGLGIVIQEASACGLPIVTTCAAGTLDVVQDGETGLLVESGNAIAMANAICELLQDKIKRERMATKSAAFAHEKFSIASVSARILAVFESLHDA